jgi:hypothetical protein
MWFFIRYLLLIALAGLAVACGSRTPGEPPVIAVVSGHVSAGPITPVSRAGQPNSRPVAGARVEALQGSRVMAVTRTDRGGYYRLALRGGTYLIAVTSGEYRLYAPRTRTVVVAAGHNVTANFMLDTGIR